MEAESELRRFDVDDQDDIENRWTRYVKRLGRYLTIKNINNSAAKINYLFFYGGEKLEDIYEEVKDDQDSYDQVIEKLTKHFKPETNTEMHIFQFRNMEQYDDETFDDYVARLKEKAKLCAFADINKEMCSQIIQRCKSKTVKKQALTKGNVKLEDVLKIGRVEENVKRQLKELEKAKAGGYGVSDASSSEEEGKQKDENKINLLKRKLNTNDHKSNRSTKQFTKADQRALMDAGKCFRCGEAYTQETLRY